MNTLTAALCKTPVLGTAMWLLSLCVANQALPDAYVDLGLPGVLLAPDIHVPMDESYTLRLLLPAAASGHAAANWADVLCGDRDDAEAGLRLTLRLSDDKGVASTQVFPVSCASLRQARQGALTMGTLTLTKGRYRLELLNDTPLEQLRGQRVQVLLTGAGAGFP